MRVAQSRSHACLVERMYLLLKSGGQCCLLGQGFAVLLTHATLLSLRVLHEAMSGDASMAFP